MTIEADTALQIAQFFNPILELEDRVIRPVADAMALMALMAQLQQQQQADNLCEGPYAPPIDCLQRRCRRRA
jgi:hypothetical protein